MEYAFFISALIGMGTEIVALSLNQVSRQDSRTIAVVVGNGSRECRNRDAVLNSISHDITQRLLIFISNLFEVRRQQQVGNTRILLVGISDLLQELSTDNATGTKILAISP
jgi:ABC-type transporter Mla MlaB component